MKKILPLILLVFNIAYSQVTTELANETIDFLDENVLEYSMTANQNTVVISRFDTGIIYKADLTQNNSTFTPVFSEAIYPKNIEIIGNELYFLEMADAAFSSNSGKLCKINLNDTNPIKQILISELNYPNALSIQGNYVFISENHLENVVDDENYDLVYSSISKISLSNPATQQNLGQFEMIQDLQNKDGYLFALNYLPEGEFVEDSEIIKINLADNSSIILHEEYVWSDNIAVLGNRLYGDIGEGGNLVSIDTNTPNSSLEIVYEDPILYNGDSCFISLVKTISDYEILMLMRTSSFETEEEKYLLYKIHLNGMNTTENQFAKISVYPNPAKEIINISGLEKENNYTIHDHSGKSVQQGKTSAQINISALPTGIYILKTDNSKPVKIIKK